MDRFFRILLALLVTLGALGTDAQTPVRTAMDCCPESADGTCPCRMPMPERGPQPCGNPAPAPVAALVRTVVIVTEQATAGEHTWQEPEPWPESWKRIFESGTISMRSAEPIPLDTGPPLLASERSARLGVFRI